MIGRSGIKLKFWKIKPIFFERRRASGVEAVDGLVVEEITTRGRSIEEADDV